METDISSIDGYAKEAIQHRRYLHAHPEPSYEEHATQEYIMKQLTAYGLDPHAIADTGVTALVNGTGSAGEGKVLLLRADIDALRLTEQTGLPFASQNPGVMHACGHDGHTGTLLAVAHWLADHRHLFGGTVRLLFQPAEEISPGGAGRCIQGGILTDPDVTFAFGMHLWNALPVGTVGLYAGALMAQSDRFTVTVHGKGAHAATPQHGADPIVAAAQIITALQTIVSRETDPLHSRVVTVGTVNGGSAFNIIPETVTMTGTLRAFSREEAENGAVSVGRIVEHCSAALGVEGILEYEPGYPVLFNRPESVALVRPAIERAAGAGHVVAPQPWMGGEDFACYLERVPGVFILVGSRNESRGIVSPHHSPFFTFDEDALGLAVRVFAAVVQGYLG
jgi:amidohydrolase